jgi:quercetin dioxygenase-like cupin family protein
MTRYALRLLEDKLLAGAATSAALPAGHRVIYVVDGEVTVAVGNQSSTITPNAAWHSAGPCSIACGAHGARLWRWELVSLPLQDGDVCPGEAIISTEKLVHEVVLESQNQYLMRCDRVDFPPGGMAYTHVHQGPGIRCLLFGAFTVCVHGEQRLIQAGEAWFESGPEPVYAAASAAEPAAFVRVMILPRALKGQSSIRYVKPEDQDKPKPQRYTMFLDQEIDL